MSAEPRIHDPRNTLVRPRAVWGGIALALLGLVLISLGIIFLRPWVVGGGCVTAGMGLVIAWRGGVLFDTRGEESPHDEVQELLHGGEHLGVSPDARAVGSQVEATAAERTQRKEYLLARSQEASPPSLRVLAAFGLVVLGAWLFLDQWFLNYPFTVTGQNSALRDVGFAVVLVLCALRLRMRTPSKLAASLVVLSGVMLLLAAVLLPHDSGLVRGNEVVAAVLVLGLATLTFS